MTNSECIILFGEYSLKIVFQACLGRDMHFALINTLSYAAAAKYPRAFFQQYYLPLGILTIAAAVEQAGHKVTIIDPNVIAFRLKRDDPEFLRAETADQILKTNPDLVGFTTMCDSYHHTLDIAARVRAASKVPIVLGGPQATVVARETLGNFPQIDFIVRGEAEGCICQLLDAIRGNGSLDRVPNLTFRTPTGSIAETANAPLVHDMNEIPIPAYHHYEELAGLVEFLPIEVGRGCPFHCDFCSTAAFFQRTYRLKSAARIIEESATLEQTFGPQKIFRFIHDMLTVNKRDIRRLCTALQQHGQQFSWSCSARIDCVSRELLHEMRAAGCKEIYFGIETGSQRLQKVIKKNLDLSEVFPISNCAAALGMDVTLSFICGFPDETEDDLSATLTMLVDAVAKLGSSVRVQLHLLAPHGGTELFAMYGEHLFFDGYLSDQVGQAITDTDAELVKRYPQIFTSFYSVPLNHYDRSILFGIDTFVYNALRDWPLTTLILREMTGSALGTFKEWQRFTLEQTSINAVVAIGRSTEAARTGLAMLVNHHISKGSEGSEVLAAVFEYESSVVSLFERTEPTLLPNQIQAHQPRLAPGAFLLKCRVDMASAYEALRSGSGLKALNTEAERDVVVMMDDQGGIQSHEISPFVAKVIELSDGKDDLLSTLASTYALPRDMVQRSLEAARQLGREIGFLI